MCCCCGHFGNEPFSRIQTHSFIYIGLRCKPKCSGHVIITLLLTGHSGPTSLSLSVVLPFVPFRMISRIIAFSFKNRNSCCECPSRLASIQWAFTRITCMRLYTKASSTFPSHDASHTHMFFQILLIHHMFGDFYRGLYIHSERMRKRGKEKKKKITAAKMREKNVFRRRCRWRRRSSVR